LKSLFKKLMHTNQETLQDLNMHRKLFFLQVLMPPVTAVFLFFSLYNWLHLDRPFIAIISLAAALILIASLVLQRLKQNTSAVINLFVISLAIFLVMFNIENQNKGFGLVWTILFPIAAIVAAGTRMGTIYALIIWATTLLVVYSGTGTWLNGEWDMTGVIRFSLAYLLMLLIIYILDKSAQQTHQALFDINANQKALMLELQTLSYTDSLTAVGNRRKLNHDIKSYATDLKNSSDTLLFFILDLDFFKAYNDHYGHFQGDQALIQVAMTVQRRLETHKGRFYRLGGEEFTGLIKLSSPDQAKSLMNHIIRCIYELEIEHSPSSYKRLTISLGYTMTQRPDFKFDDLYKEADAALYEAKNNGRNQAVAAI